MNLILDAKKSANLSAEGLKQLQLDNYVAAIQKFNEALDIVPESPHALQGRAFCKPLLCLTNLQLNPDQIQTYAREIVSDLEVAINAIKHHYDV